MLHRECWEQALANSIVWLVIMNIIVTLNIKGTSADKIHKYLYTFRYIQLGIGRKTSCGRRRGWNHSRRPS